MRGSSLSELLTNISVIGLVAAANPAYAQAQADSSSAPQTTIEDIVVTAQKQEQSLQDVPVSVAAVSPQKLQDLNATNLASLQGSVPNLQVSGNSTKTQSSLYAIRGIGIIDADPYAGNTVSIVVDGVPQFFAMGSLADIYDVERIEVLKGPQGTLFGANTTGGVVNVINTQPKDEFEAKADFSYGNYNRFRAAGALNLPLAESLAARFVVSHDSRDGFFTNVVDGSNLGHRNATLFRGAVKYAPGPDFDMTLSGEYVRVRNGAPIVVQGALPGELTYVPTGFRNQYQSPCFPAGQRCSPPDRYVAARTGGPIAPDGTVVDPIQDRSDMDAYRGTLTINLYDTAIGDITAITGYRTFTLKEDTDEGASSVWMADTVRETDAWQFSQEVRTAVDLNDRIKLQIGTFAMWDHYRQDGILRLNFSAPTQFDFATNTVTYGFPGIHQYSLQDQDNYSISAFAQSYIDVTDQLRVQAGIRYTYEQTSMLALTNTTRASSGLTTLDGRDYLTGLPNAENFGSVAPPRDTQGWKNVGWKLGVDYKFTPDVMLYGYWARGFKSGGYTGRLSVASDLGPYDPEYVDTFEIGVKADLFNRRVRANLTGFYTNYRDMQLSQIYFITTAEGSQTVGSTILNAASSEIKGIEAELTVVPFDGFTIFATGAYLDAKYKDFDYQVGDGDVLDLSGQRLQQSPKWAASVSATYEFPVGDMRARLNAQYNYQSEKLLSNIIDTPRARVQPTHIVNANADLMINERITAGVYATNLFDNRYVSVTNDFPGVIAPISYADPRMYGVKVSFRY